MVFPFDMKCASYLINSLERDMRTIKTEFEKIIAFSKESQITKEDIDKVIIKPASENVYALIDAIFDGRREICYNLLYTLRSLKQEPVSILTLLSNQLITIYRAKLYLLDGMSHRDTVSKLGGGFPAEKCTQKAEKLKIENIETLISLCQECDMKTKNGLLGGWAALESVIAEYNYY